MKKAKIYLIALVALVVTSLGAMAQGGSSPLVGSTHKYTITPESTTNTLLWSVVEASGYSINSQTVVATKSEANITWTSPGTYHLRFRETNGSLCYTSKEITVVVGANTFDVSASAVAATCNAASGQVNFVGTSAKTSITFPVTMTTGKPLFNPNWEIEFTLTPGTGATITNVGASSGTLTGAGPYKLTALTSATGTGSVNITLDVEGDIYTVLNPVFTITSAKELNYNTPDVDNTDWTATQTINAVPSTSTISAD